MSTICITTGVPGSGKTYVRCARFLVDNFLPNQSGTHYSNFPVNRDVCADFVHKKITRRSLFARFFYRFFKKLTADDIKNRIHIIPYEVIQSWRSETSGPWDYFNGIDLKYAHIAIDEVHEVISTTSSSDYVKKWDDFLGTIRHRGCVFEGITQDFLKVNRVFTGRASVRYELCPAEDLRDPFFSIKVMDWYELKAGLTGEFHKTVFQVEKRKSGSGRWAVNHTERYIITPDYFKFYNSFNASLQEIELKKADGNLLPLNPFFENPVAAPADPAAAPADPAAAPADPAADPAAAPGEAADRVPLYEYQKRNKLGIIAWFLHRNWFNLVSRLALVVLVCWLCFFGGIAFLINNFVGFLVKRTDQRSKSEIMASVPDAGGAAPEVGGAAPDAGGAAPEVGGAAPDAGGAAPDAGGAAPDAGGAAPDAVGAAPEFEKTDPYKIVLLDFNQVIFYNGLVVGRGEKFPENSKYGGSYVSNFDVRKRVVVLSDGSILRMRPIVEN